MPVRTVAVFHNTAQVGSAWACAEGISHGLAKLGCRVIDCGNPKHTRASIQHLERVDAIILGAPEWFAGPLLARYGQAWFDLKAPKVAWYAESASRDDRDFPFQQLQPLADLHYFPAAQDAEAFGGTWLPFGADIDVFKPLETPRLHPVGFIGSMYQKRREFIERIGFPLTVLPQTGSQDSNKPPIALVEAYNSVEIFVNMPAYSRLLVTKVTEVMACRTMLVTPAMDHPSALRNMTTFESGRHLVYYDPARPEDLREVLEHYKAHPDERQAVADAGYAEVRERHTQAIRLQAILADVEALIAARG